jgi:hypothetical protein
VCRTIESAALAHGLGHLSRLTANLLRPVPIADLEVAVATDYAGRNAGHFSARLKAAGKDVASFTALAQRESDVRLPDDLPGHPLPAAPQGPDDSPEATFPFAGKHVGYADLVDGRGDGAGRMTSTFAAANSAARVHWLLPPWGKCADRAGYASRI